MFAELNCYHYPFSNFVIDYIIVDFKRTMTHYYRSSNFHNKNSCSETYLNQSPKFSNAYEIKKPQPSQLMKITKTQQLHSNSGNSNEVLRSNDILASFGFCPENMPHSSQKSKPLSHISPDKYSDLQLTKKLKTNAKNNQIQSFNRTQNLRSKNVAFEHKEQTKTNEIVKNQKFYSFLYKLSGMLASHFRSIATYSINKIGLMAQYKEDNIRYLYVILSRLERRKIQSGFINMKFNSMQHSEVVRVDNLIDNSQSKTWNKSFTKIDMLAEEYIEIDYSSIEKDPSTKDITLKNYETKNKSENPIPYFNFGQLEKQGQVSPFNHLKGKNSSLNNYGFNMKDIMKNAEKQKKKLQRDYSQELSIFSNQAKTKMKDGSQLGQKDGEIIANRFSSSIIKVDLEEYPLKLKSKFETESQNSHLDTQNVDFLRQQFPDAACQLLEQNELLNFFESVRNRSRKLQNPLIKNIDSFIENKGNKDFGNDNASISRSVQSMKMSVGQSERQRVKKKSKYQNANIKPIEQYHTEKQIIPGKKPNLEKNFDYKKDIQRPKSMTQLQVNFQHLKGGRTLNLQCPRKTEQQYLPKQILRPANHISVHNNQRAQFYAKQNNFRPQSIESRERAQTGIHKYHLSPIEKKTSRHHNNNHLAKDPIVVYFTATSPKKTVLQPEKQALSPRSGSNYYGIKKVPKTPNYFDIKQQRYLSPQVQAPQTPQPHCQPKREYHQKQREVRNTFDAKETPIKGLEKDSLLKQQQQVSLLKRAKSVSNQKIKVVSAIKRKN